MFYTYRKHTGFELPTLPFYVVETKLFISPYHLKLTFGFGVYKDDTDDRWSKMRKFFAALCVQITLGCDSKCLEKRLEVLERRYDADLNFQELTRAAHDEFDDKIENILVSKRFTSNRIGISYYENDLGIC